MTESSASSDSDSDDSSMSLGGRLRALTSLSESLDIDFLRELLLQVNTDDSDEDDDSGPRHRSIVCDCCCKSNFSGPRYMCG